MKKFVVGMLATMAAIVLCVCFSACTTTFTGTWKLSSMYVKVGGIEQTIEVGKNYDGQKISADAIILEVNEDNTYILKGDLVQLAGGEQNGTWKEEGDNYVFENEGVAIKVTFDGSKLIMENSAEGMTVKITFKK